MIVIVFSQCLVLENIKIFFPHPLALGKRKLNAVSACMYTFTTKVSWKLTQILCILISLQL